LYKNAEFRKKIYYEYGKAKITKIAAFLKDYGFVKEYGEGVDRMCRELAAIGLPDPVFDNNTFILKTTIQSASYEKLPIGEKEVADSAQKLPIGEEKVADSAKNVAIEYQKVTDSAKNVAIEKIPLLEILRLCDIKNYDQARRRISLRFHAACFYGRLRLLSCEAVERVAAILRVRTFGRHFWYNLYRGVREAISA